jgi:DNA topoisomerase-3
MPKLYIAEKPSVARDIAAALGSAQKTEDFIRTSTGDAVCAASGHLLTHLDPEDYDPTWKSWQILPIIPAEFKIKPASGDHSKLLSSIKRAIATVKPTEIVNACDAGREGELIFRLIWDYLKLEGKYKMKRLWLQSMTENSILHGIQNLKEGSAYDNLATAAKARSEADWLVGINGTRAASNALRKPDVRGAWSVGRVQTPTLAMIVDRDATIKQFVPKTFWNVTGTFQVTDGQTYQGTWFDPNWVKNEADPDQGDDRFFKPDLAKTVAARTLNQPALIEEKVHTLRQAPKKLFNLTNLQREANKRYGFTAKRTLEIAQGLYEKAKAITYPRTDSDALPEDYPPECVRILAALANQGYASQVAQTNPPDTCPFKKAIFDDKAISDHFAIIPTGNGLTNGTPEEEEIYRLIAERFIAAFCDYAEIEEKQRVTVVQNAEKDSFKSTCKTVIKPGWQALEGVKAGESKPTPLPGKNGDPSVVSDTSVKEGKTTPPKRFSEASILAAMESAGKIIEDEQMRKQMADKGLGTPATRAAILETLKEREYITCKGKELLATEKAFTLIRELRSRNLTVLTSPELTGDWELRLKNIEKGTEPVTTYMDEIIEYTKDIVKKLPTKSNGATPTATSQTPRQPMAAFNGKCPVCGAPLVAEDRMVKCSKNIWKDPKACWFIVWRKTANRVVTDTEIEQLCTQGSTDMLTGFISEKTRAPFSARLVLDKKARKVTMEFPPRAGK